MNFMGEIKIPLQIAVGAKKRLNFSLIFNKSMVLTFGSFLCLNFKHSQGRLRKSTNKRLSIITNGPFSFHF